MRTRPVTVEDAEELAAAVTANRAFLAPWEPVRPDSWFTPEGQRDTLKTFVELAGLGIARGHVILDDDAAIVGRINLANLILGAFRSCHLGYWVAEHANGRGYATQAVGEMLDVAFGPLALHRVEASTLVHNEGSQRVLERNGFTRIGLAPHYLEIAGSWQDHVMFQITAEDRA